jgi:protein involved in plasmid replication-relaxation
MSPAQRRPRSFSRTSSRPALVASSLSDLDRQLLSTLSSHRVVTQTQLKRLFNHVPSRTLRYRTRRLHELRLLGRTRPYRDSGSAPCHLWPTRRADALVRGEPAPRGGERRSPNPLFLAHAAALTELYVVLATEAPAHGLELRDFRREGEAREPFRSGGKERALAPDVFLTVRDGDGRVLVAFVELDRGTMSHRRLRQKADLYAAYDHADAWLERHRFCPALVFLTTTEARAARFLRSLHTALEHERRYRGGELTSAAGPAALDPGRALRERCLIDQSLSRWLTLGECLDAARLPYDRRRAAQAARERAEAEARERLLADPEELRTHLFERRDSLGQYLEPLGRPAARAFRVAIESAEPLVEAQRAALEALARSIGDELLDLRGFGGSWAPDAELQRAADSLVAHYRAVQESRVAELARRHGEGPSLRRATAQLAAGQFFDAYELAELADAAARGEQGRAKQQDARLAYLKLREREARRLAREEGFLRRLATPREEFYPRVDRDWLKFCSRCREVAYPTLERTDPYAPRPELRCHYCDAGGLADVDPARFTDQGHDLTA